MTDPIEAAPVRVELDSGELVETAGAAVRLTMPAARAHGVAHLLADWAASAGPVVGRAAVSDTSVLARLLEDSAALLGDPDATLCAVRLAGSVPSRNRLAAVDVLGGQEEPALSMLQRLAAVDAAGRWLDEDAGDELAYALLAAVCSTETRAGRAYLALLTGSRSQRPGGTGRG
jgi:hypothetical protein